MKRILITSIAVLAGFALHAQKVTAGKSYQAIVDSKTTVSMNVQGASMDIPTTVQAEIGLQIKSADNNTITGSCAVKHIKVSTSAMGQEQSFDSNDSAMKSNPEVSKLMQDQNFTLTNGKLSDEQKADAGLQVTGLDIVNKLLLPVSADKLKENYTWKENKTDSGSSSEINYTISKLTSDDVEISFTTSIKINNTIQQMGMDMKQSLTGTIKGTRLYSRASGTLKSDSEDKDFTGSYEVMAQQMPVTIKGTSTTVIK